MKHLLTALLLGLTAVAVQAQNVEDPMVSPKALCAIKGREAKIVAEYRDKGRSEAWQKEQISSRPVDTQDDEDFEVRMIKMVHKVYNTPQYFNVAPHIVAAMVEDECFNQLPVGDD